jgi:predicted HicB family RNase H-like nuclease
MGKRDLLKDSMKGGLNSLLSSTTPSYTENESVKIAKEKEKETAVHCNFLINKSIHTRMKYLAIDKNMSLKDIVNEAMKEYLDKYEKK